LVEGLLLARIPKNITKVQNLKLLKNLKLELQIGKIVFLTICTLKLVQVGNVLGKIPQSKFSVTSPKQLGHPTTK
jgi:hypothetical protein